MSLLLSALKKAEGQDESGSGNQFRAVSSSVPVGMDSTKLETSDGDSFGSVDAGTSAQKGEGISLQKQKRRKVDAAHVFVAGGQSDAIVEHSWWLVYGRKILVGLLVLGLIGGGAFYGVDQLTGIFPSDEEGAGVARVVDSSTTTLGGEGAVVSQLEISDDVQLLPIPVVDVQSEIDFASLSLPENSREVLGDEGYRQKIAVLTGYDELDRFSSDAKKGESEGIGDGLPSQSSIDFSFDEENVDAESREGGVDTGGGFATVRDADLSRQTKFRLDSTTPSEGSFDVAINGGSSSSKEEEIELVPSNSSSTVADVQIGLSEDGVERNHLLKRARQLYRSASYIEAESIYRQVLVSSPSNINALRGLAQVAVATRRPSLAASTYLKILGFYPDDPVAVSELINLSGQNGGRGDFYEVERILKRLIGKRPEIDGRIYFSLGNLYADNGKWFEAQQAYFEALSRENDNPDYSYNLAVVLDYLNKPGLALRHYRQSLSLSKKSGAVGFSRREVEARIKDLDI